MAMSDIELVRIFIAAEISSGVRQNLAAAQTALKPLPCRIGWVAPLNIHLTLVFLGDVFPERIAAVKTVLDSAAAATRGCTGEVCGLGFFGSPRHPRVIWAGLTGNLEPLIQVQAKLGAELKAQGFYLDDRPFAPHLTLGRLRAVKGTVELIDALEKYRETAFGLFTVDRLLLMRSRLTARGPEYTTLHQAAFPSQPAAARES